MENQLEKRVKLSLNDGDIYVMSEKASGYDWKKKKLLTLRHAAGCEKFLTIKAKAPKKAKTDTKKKRKEESDDSESDEEDSS